MYRLFSIGVIVTIAGISAWAQTARPGVSSIDELAARVAGPNATVAEKTTQLVSWINSDFAWTATDYQKRTPEEIIERRGGNCADLARVLARLLDGAHIRYRFVREINLQPASDTRQANAAAKIASGGARFSVFGLRHNDHMWLEVFDTETNDWMPADPAVGVVGIDQWISARLAFDQRRQPAVAATVPIVQAMLAPFAVVSGTEDRSAHYLIDAFDRAYSGRLHSLQAWPRWCSAVRELGPLAMEAFTGDLNLHEHAASISEAAEAYDTLRQQAATAGITLK